MRGDVESSTPSTCAYIYVYICIIGSGCLEIRIVGICFSVEWRGLPTRLQWALAPARLTKLGSQPEVWLPGVCICLEVGIEGLLLRHGGKSPGRVLGVPPQGLLSALSSRGTSLAPVVWCGTPYISTPRRR